jgi:hypothetical protein
MRESLRYPIGPYERPTVITAEVLEQYINIIETFPSDMVREVSHLNDEQLNTPYRDGGWTIRQVVHHCADSHMNSLIRFKLALTEDEPTIKPYQEDLWAELPDGKELSISHSISLLEGLHARWAFLLKSLNSAHLKRTFIHPESKKVYTLDENIGLYAWHCQHHLAHITTLKGQNNWK